MLGGLIRAGSRCAVRPSVQRSAPSPRHVVRVTTASRRVCRPRSLLVAASASLTEGQVAQLTSDLRALESERDEAVRTAESCARTAVRLEEMVGLLEELALSKVKEGDDDAARSVLKEKKAVAEVLGRSQQRAHTNYALAAKLADKIGGLQRTLMGTLAPAAQSSDSRRPPAVPQPSSAAARDSSTSGATSFSSGNPSPSGSVPPRPPRAAPWELSLAEAQQRIAQAEAAATAAGATAAASARETIEEARARLRAQAEASVVTAQSRIRTQTGESLAAARARLAAQEAEALSRVRQLMARYRAGEYVSEDELDWAFRVLERRTDSPSTSRYYQNY